MATYKFFQKKTGQWIEAEEEVWRWEAYFSNGQILKQYSDDGLYHQFGEIDQSQLALFKMISTQSPQVYSVIFADPDMKLIHFYRNTVLAAGSEHEKHIRFYCFGYEKKIASRTQKVIMMITPEGNLIVTEDPDLVTPEIV